MSSTNPFAQAAPAPPTSSPPKRKIKKTSKGRIRKYNAFNIFFMLERQYLLNQRGGGINAIEDPIDTSGSSLTRPNKPLRLPPLCTRYSHLPFTSNWFLELTANSGKKRCHRRTHGKISFRELAGTVAKNYRGVDDETRDFVNGIAELLAEHMREIEAIEAQEKWDAMQARAAAGLPLKKRKDAPVVSTGSVAAAAGGIKRAKDETLVSSQGFEATRLSPLGGLGLQHQHQHQLAMAMGINPLPFTHAQAHNSAQMAHAQMMASSNSAMALPQNSMNFNGHQAHFPMNYNQARSSLVGYPQEASSMGPSQNLNRRRDSIQLEMAQAIQDRMASESRIQALNDRLQAMNQHHQANNAREGMQEPLRLQQAMNHHQATSRDMQEPSGYHQATMERRTTYPHQPQRQNYDYNQNNMSNSLASNQASMQQASLEREYHQDNRYLPSSSMRGSMSPPNNMQQVPPDVAQAAARQGDSMLVKLEEELLREELVRRMMRRE